MATLNNRVSICLSTFATPKHFCEICKLTSSERDIMLRDYDASATYFLLGPTVQIAMKPVKDASHLYEVERRALHAERPGFRISELQISPSQKVPWHYHNHVQDTFYVIEGHIRLFLRTPEEDIRLGPGDVYRVQPKRPHLVTNDGEVSATFLVLQGPGEYDYVGLT